VLGLAAAGIKKPTTVASRGFLSKLFRSSTRTNGVAYYDDQQVNLSNFVNHGAEAIRTRRTGQVWD